MPLLTSDQVKSIVLQALQTVADLPADPENADFSQMRPEHQKVFLTSLKDLLNAYPYPGGGAYYDVVLNMDVFGQWKIVQDCIDYVTANQMVVYP